MEQQQQVSGTGQKVFVIPKKANKRVVLKNASRRQRPYASNPLDPKYAKKMQNCQKKKDKTNNYLVKIRTENAIKRANAPPQVIINYEDICKAREAHQRSKYD